MATPSPQARNAHRAAPAVRRGRSRGRAVNHRPKGNGPPTPSRETRRNRSRSHTRSRSRSRNPRIIQSGVHGASNTPEN